MSLGSCPYRSQNVLKHIIYFSAALCNPAPSLNLCSEHETVVLDNVSRQLDGQSPAPSGCDAVPPSLPSGGGAPDELPGSRAGALSGGRAVCDDCSMPTASNRP